jgi:hypothetical protein
MKPLSRSRAWCPSGEFPPRSGARCPSGGFPPRSRPPSTHDVTLAPPIAALNALTPRGRLVQGESPPRQPSDTARNHITVLFDQPALWGCYAGRLVSFHDAMHVAPSKEDDGTLERSTATYPAPAWDGVVTSRQRSTSPPSPPALCSHPCRCAAIPGTAVASLTLWEPKSMRHRHAHRCTAPGLPSAKPSNWRTGGDQTRAPVLLPSKPPLDRHRIHHDARQRQDSPRQLSILQQCTPCRRTQHLEPRGMTVNHLPLLYKRRQSPGHRGTTDSNSLACPPSPTILALILNQPSGTWRFLLLSHIACSSPLRAPRCIAIQRHERTSAGRTAHGRNQDKPRVTVLLSRPSRGRSQCFY